MAGTVMHLVVADKLLDKLNIKDPASFYCGNLAPDAIMARENYEREMKNHTHFKDGIGLRMFEFRQKERQEEYHKKFNDFVERFLDKESPEYELYLGYVVHMLTDELYLLDYYESFLVELEAQGKELWDEEFVKGYVSDVDRVDWEIVREYTFKHKMPDILRSKSGYEITDFITADELESSKQYIIWRNFETSHEKTPLAVTTYEKNYDFIDLCVERIPSMLQERFGVTW